MFTVFTLLLPLFSLIGLGYLAGRTKIAQLSWVSTLNQFGYYISFPALIFKSLAFVDLSVQQHGGILLVQLGIGILITLISYGVARASHLPRTDRNTFMIGVYFSNAGYIGIPALQLVYGDMAAAEGTVIVATMIAVTLSLGIYFLTKSKSKTVRWKKLVMNMIVNPLMAATLLGFIIGFSQIQLPTILEQFIVSLAGSASPVVLVALGIFIAFNHPKKHALRLAGYITVSKMILIPTVLGVIIWLLPHSDWLQTTFIQSSMPVAVTAFALAQIYPMDKSAVSTSIVLSTLASIVIVPVVMWLAPGL